MSPDISARSTAPASISRRRIVQGAAWAAPAVVIATAAPAFAAASNAALANVSLLVQQNGNSSNFIVELSANISGVASGEVMTLIGAFDAGASTITVTDNSSGWAVTSPSGSGASFQWIAQRTHDGSTSVAVAKFKFTASVKAAISQKPVTLSLYVGSQLIGSISGAIPVVS